MQIQLIFLSWTAYQRILFPCGNKLRQLKDAHMISAAFRNAQLISASFHVMATATFMCDQPRGYCRPAYGGTIALSIRPT
jgi:hypothetical protein